jgi:hypothetical protein
MQRICAKYACFSGNYLVRVELTGPYHLPERAAMDGTFMRIEVILITVTRSTWQLSNSYVLMRVAGSRMLVLAGQVGDAHV